VALVDPLAGIDRAGLAALLTVPGQVKVLHAARQDVEVLLPVTTTPLAPVLDTQLAAALLGFAPQVGYGDLIAAEFGVTLEKSQARTDWTRRPLTPAQLSYAADDVRYLLPLAARLEERLAGLGRLGWFHEDTALLADPGLYRLDPADAWQRFKAIETLPPREQARLRALAAWREARAMRRNLPRGWVLTDDAARTLARAAPAHLAALKALEVMPPGAADKLGAEILAALADAATAPLDALVQRNEGRPGPEERELTRRLGERVRQLAGQLAIAPEVLAPQRDLRRLARGEAVAAVLRGWRLAELGTLLEDEQRRG
jgi:ribonuclease D